MTEEEIVKELLEFFKALAEENRLKIIGRLAQEPCTVEALAESIGIGVSTTSHHLSRLSKAGLVSAKTDGHYYIYSLNTGALEAKAKKLLTKDTLPNLSKPLDSDTFERKVLSAFTEQDGRIIAFPAQEKKFIVLLKYALKAFTPGKHYSEKEVNNIFLQFNEDVAILRRGMIEYKLMDRLPGGREYWVVD